MVVPRRLRADWREEWAAELLYHEALLTRWGKLNRWSKRKLISHSVGAFWDAVWLQPRRWEDEMFQDLRFGVRMLIKHKSFTAVAVLSLALGIGASTAIFQLLDAVRLRRLPVRAPNELAELRLSDTKGVRGGVVRPISVTNRIWEEIRDRQQSFSSVAAWGTDTVNLAPGGEVRPVRVLWVSGDFFKMLNVVPAFGRPFTPTDDQRGCGTATVVISHDFWQREFGGDPNVIGRKLTFADHTFEVTGVTPASFFGMEVGRSFDLAMPICAVPLVRGNNNFLEGPIWWLTVTGRMKPGWSLDETTAHMQAISPELFRAALPPNYPAASVKDFLASKLVAMPAGSGVSELREKYEQPLWLLLAIAGLVLLIACANLANLLLARANAREREVAVRQALGASRGRLIRQFLVESFLLAFMGALLGTAVAQALSRILVAMLSTSVNQVFLDLNVDWRVLVFAIVLTLLTCLLFGLAPAVYVTRKQPGTVMKIGGRGQTAGRERFILGRGLVVAQIALSLVLVAGALLFSRSLGKLLAVDTGFRPDGVTIATVIFRQLNLSPETIPAFKDQLHDRLQAIPGIQSVAFTNIIPLRDGGGASAWPDGSDTRQAMQISLSRVGPDYFKTLNVPLLAGREFDGRDRLGAPNVAIVNETCARRLMNGANPVGRRFRVEATPNNPETSYEIVGLVRDTKYADLREPYVPIAYYAAAQNQGAGPGGTFLIRSSLSQAQTVREVNRVLAEINPGISVSFQGFKSMIDTTVLRERLMATVSSFFGGLALLLACIGVYGVLSYRVASRTNEIGIRAALGAQRRDLYWLILREALLLLVFGLVVGLPLTFGITRLASALLFELGPNDPLSLSLAALTILAVSLIAGYIPSRRATRVDPWIAVRCE